MATQTRAEIVFQLVALGVCHEQDVLHLFDLVMKKRNHNRSRYHRAKKAQATGDDKPRRKCDKDGDKDGDDEDDDDNDNDDGDLRLDDENLARRGGGVRGRGRGRDREREMDRVRAWRRGILGGLDGDDANDANANGNDANANNANNANNDDGNNANRNNNANHNNNADNANNANANNANEAVVNAAVADRGRNVSDDEGGTRSRIRDVPSRQPRLLVGGGRTDDDDHDDDSDDDDDDDNAEGGASAAGRRSRRRSRRSRPLKKTGRDGSSGVKRKRRTRSRRGGGGGDGDDPDDSSSSSHGDSDSSGAAAADGHSSDGTDTDSSSDDQYYYPTDSDVDYSDSDEDYDDRSDADDDYYGDGGGGGGSNRMGGRWPSFGHRGRRRRGRRGRRSSDREDDNDRGPPVNLNDPGSNPTRGRRSGGPPTKGPSLLLWGRPGESVVAVGKTDGELAASTAAAAAAPAAAAAAVASSNGLASNDDSVGNKGGEEGEAKRNDYTRFGDLVARHSRNREKKDPVIPRTWLSSAFTAASDYSGLALAAPPPEEVAYLRRIQRKMRLPPKSPLPPYHCTGATLLMSFVTGLMYAGASVQGNAVNCNQARKGFGDLSEDERKREFESRLVDALAAVLHVAAKESTKKREKAVRRLEKRVKYQSSGGKKRKRKKSRKDKDAKSAALNKTGDDVGVDKANDEGQGRKPIGMDYEDDEKEKDVAYLDWQKMRIQRLRRRLRLCPVCRWEENPVSSEPRFPPAPSSLLDPGYSDDDNDDRSSGSSLQGGAAVKISVSYTNICDLRQYVVANIGSFVSPGGCALFLETLVRIVGVRRIRRTLRDQKVPSPIVESLQITPSLLACTCTERVCARWERNTKAKASNPLPAGHGCISPHLVNLLLSGLPKEDLASSSTGGMGVGMLAMPNATSPGGLGGALQNPSRPVWLVRGEKCYSLLRVAEDRLTDPVAQKHLASGRLGSGGDSFLLVHHNPWYGFNYCTEMRVYPGIKSSAGNASPTSAADVDASKKVNAQGAAIISQEEIDGVAIHPQDESFYPKEYHRWRFDVSSVHCDSIAGTGSNNGGGGSAGLVPAEASTVMENHHKWTPFYRLSERQKLAVETKLAPKIKLIVWSKWPRSTVEFVSSDDSPPFV
mmetsp:Transcript_13236/g.28033  ORF Transcript_13236/g.28033 Transcript_13236/m.28033 type:complete len:1135 (-) Transcript_13236:199-3603(-)